jgi:ribosomal protein S18 acetylase RimI-like enzyme
MDFVVRRASADDGEAVARVMERIVADRVHSAIDRAWTGEEERAYLMSLSDREAVHVAVARSGEVVGCQTLDLYSRTLASTSHVAQVGTFVLPEWRGRGVGSALFEETTVFARSAGYRKIVIQVRASNPAAQAFYRKLGFEPCGRLARQVAIDEREDDEVIMEMMLG